MIRDDDGCGMFLLICICLILMFMAHVAGWI